MTHEQMIRKRPDNFYLISDIENKILEVANLFNDVPTSDLQAIAYVKAVEIIKLVKGE